MKYLLTATITAIAMSTAAGALALTYTVKDLGALGAANSFANDLNESGQVVGSIARHFSAFRYDDTGGMTDLGTMGGNNSKAFGINASG